MKSVWPAGSVRACCSSARRWSPKPTIDRARVEPAQRLEQEVDALVLDQLPEVDDDRPVRREERGEPLGVALVRQPLVRVARDSADRARASSSSAGERLRRAARGTNSLDVDARRHLEARGSTGPTTCSSTSRMCAEPT